MFSKIIVCIVSFLAAVNGFMPKTTTLVKSSSLKMSVFDSASFFVSELYASPTARYGGELVDKSLKLVDKVPKPAGYEYGAVSADGLPLLAILAVAVVVLAGAVPYFLAIGETAQSQQRVREASDKTTINQFVTKGKPAAASGIKVGAVKKAGVPNPKAAGKAAAAPAAAAPKKSLFGGKPAAKATPAAAPPAPPAKKSFFGKK